MHDLVIGCVTNYDWDKVKVWANSLKASGFTGSKIMIVMNGSYEFVDKLIAEGFSVCTFKKNDATRRVEYPQENSVMVDRFFHIWDVLSKLSYEDFESIRYVIATDVGDVVFQRNPSDALDHQWAVERPPIIVSSEGLKYKDEAWGIQNMRLSFPSMAKSMEEREILNAGVLAATPSMMKAICQTVFLMSRSTIQYVPGGGGPDQAALNILLRSAPYRNLIATTTTNGDWACQAGTTADPNKIESFRPNLMIPEPVFHNGVVRAPYHIAEYAIVHQYNRIPIWKTHFERKFG